MPNETHNSCRALREIWRVVAIAHKENKRLTKDQMINMMMWCAHGLGIDPFKPASQEIPPKAPAPMSPGPTVQ